MLDVADASKVEYALLIVKLGCWKVAYRRLVGGMNSFSIQFAGSNLGISSHTCGTASGEL